MSTDTRDTYIGWALVAAQAILIGAIVLIPRDPAWNGGVPVDIVAWAMVAAGAALGAWAALHLGRGLTPLPLPNGATDLVTRGPYRWIRHPIYTAVILACGGIALRTRTPLVLATAVALALFLNWKASWEERYLIRMFAGYPEYASRTGRFLPIPLGRGAESPGPGTLHSG